MTNARHTYRPSNLILLENIGVCVGCVVLALDRHESNNQFCGRVVLQGYFGSWFVVRMYF